VKTTIMVLRLLFGLHFLVNGLNFFFHFFTIPLPHNPVAVALVKDLVASGTIFNAVKTVEVAVGVLLLANRFVPLALVLAFPVALNIFFVDVFLVGTLFGGWILGGGTLLLNVVLLFGYFKYYRPMLAMKTEPGWA
jgi:putative oxidoreductase